MFRVAIETDGRTAREIRFRLAQAASVSPIWRDRNEWFAPGG